MAGTFYLGHCRHYKAADDMTMVSGNIRSDCKLCVYFTPHNCGMPQLQNSAIEFYGGVF